MEELCRLRVEWFRHVDGVHVHVFDISEDEDGWNGKTAASLRTVPVHHKLEELGLITFVEGLRRQGKSRLFEELTIGRHGYGRKVGDWFNNRYRKKCGIVERGKTLHSLRHTFIDELKQANADTKQIMAIVGHDDKSMTTGRYGDDYKPSNLLQVVKLVDFGIDHPKN